jgi:glycosyltransferase involved in cell wall biosynthesis
MSQALARQTLRSTLVAKGVAADVAEYYGLDHPPHLKLVEFTSRWSIFKLLKQVLAITPVDLAIARYVYAAVLTAMRGIPTVYEIHSPAQGYKKVLERVLFWMPRLVAVVFITRALRDHYVKTYPQLLSKAVVLPDAANDPPEVVLPRTDQPLRVGYVGSWYQGRGVEVIADLARLLPNIEFVAAGGGEIDLRERGITVPANLECLGYVAPRDVAGVLCSVDVLLAPYQREIRVAGNQGNTAAWSSPMKFFEYMAHGKAIISSDLPVFREVMHDGKNCILLPPDEVAAWENALKQLDQNRHLLQRLGAQARADFLENYSWDLRAKKLLEFVGPRMS